MSAALPAEWDTFSFERELTGKGVLLVAGVDEAGRGPLAGPVVAASVILPADCRYSLFQDSKKLTEKQRDTLFATLTGMGIPIGVGVASPEEIDEINILQASLLAMKRAVLELPAMPDFLLVDGKFTVPLQVNQQALVKGESKSASIAAASIVAKVTRDKIMRDYHATYPCYNFEKHKGYPTKEHRDLLRQFGPCEIHRKTFSGVQELLAG
ncbi:MAG: ribonuclease HII [Desulfobulbaceae bacterium]|nr:ribonuclease HII [Desulfobulbaceae bacterium]